MEASRVPSAYSLVGSLFYPAPRPALLGLPQPALAGCQSPGGGDQLVGAQGLEQSAAMSWCCLPVTLHLWLTLQQAGRRSRSSARRPHNPPTPRLELRTPRAVGSAAGSAAGRECIGFVRILLPNLASSQTHPAPGKRALLTSPGPALGTFCHPPGGQDMAGSLLRSEAHPRAPCTTGTLMGEGLLLPTTTSFS